MLRKLFAPRKRRVPIAQRFARLQLEQLEKREVLDASVAQGLGFLAYSAYQVAQQSAQLQATTQADLTHFHQDAAAYTAGQGVTLTQINQDIAKLQQDASGIQGFNATFNQDAKFFILGLLGNVSNLTSNDTGTVAAGLYLLHLGKGQIDSAVQTADQAASVTPPSPPSSSPPPGSSSTSSQLVTLTLNPLNVNLLGLNVQTSQITINISGQSGNGLLLGNLLGDASNLVNLPAVSGVVNNILANVVTLLNSGSLSVTGVTTTGSLGSSSSPGTTSVLTLHVAPVTLNLMGAVVTTSPIDLTLTAQSGQGLVLGNVVSDLANIFNPPLPSTLSLDDINNSLGNLITQLNQQLPSVTPPPPVTLSNGQFLDVIVNPINLNLLGLVLQTSQIQVTASNQTGNGDLLGNIGTVLLNTVGANPTNLTTFNNDLNTILSDVVGVLNNSTLTLPAGAIGSLSPVLQELTSPTLVTSTVPSTAPILNLAIASNNGGPPINLNLLGLQIATSNIQAQLTAQTGDGQVLGNLVYNLANLLNPGGSASLLPILGALGL